ncbi:Adhesion G protein-coupled receptor L3, partial [Trichoplax sp. H2]
IRISSSSIAVLEFLSDIGNTSVAESRSALHTWHEHSSNVVDTPSIFYMTGSSIPASTDNSLTSWLPSDSLASTSYTDSVSSTLVDSYNADGASLIASISSDGAISRSIENLNSFVSLSVIPSESYIPSLSSSTNARQNISNSILLNLHESSNDISFQISKSSSVKSALFLFIESSSCKDKLITSGEWFNPSSIGQLNFYSSDYFKWDTTSDNMQSSTIQNLNLGIPQQTQIGLESLYSSKQYDGSSSAYDSSIENEYPAFMIEDDAINASLTSNASVSATLPFSKNNWIEFFKPNSVLGSFALSTSISTSKNNPSWIKSSLEHHINASKLMLQSIESANLLTSSIVLPSIHPISATIASQAIQIDNILDYIYNAEKIDSAHCNYIVNAVRHLSTEHSGNEAESYIDGLSIMSNKLILNDTTIDVKRNILETLIYFMDTLNAKFTGTDASKNALKATTQMNIINEIGNRIALTLPIGASFSVSYCKEACSNLTIQVQNGTEFRKTGYRIAYNLSRTEKVAIQLSNDAFNSGGRVEIVSGKYAFLNKLLDGNSNLQKSLVSDIVVCKVNPLPPSGINEFFTFSTSNLTTMDKTNSMDHSYTIKCVYWNIGSSSWLSDGCRLALAKKGNYTCACNHLTHFAILLQVTEIDIHNASSLLQEINLVAYIGLGISIASIVLTLLIFTLLRLNSERFTIHKNLLLAILLSQICLVASPSANINPIFCKIAAICLHFFCFASFSWMLVEGVHLYFMIIAVFNQKTRSHYYHIVGWGMPLVVVGFSVLIRFDGYGGDERCWLSTKDGLIWAFVGPVIAIISINTIIMVAVIKITVTSTTVLVYQKNIENFAGIKSMVKATAILCPLLGLTWILGMIPISGATIVMSYVYVILNSTQVRQAYHRMVSKRQATSMTGKSQAVGTTRGPGFRRNSKYADESSVEGRFSSGRRSLFTNKVNPIASNKGFGQPDISV